MERTRTQLYGRALVCAVCALLAACGSRSSSRSAAPARTPRIAQADTLAAQEDSTSARFYVYDPGKLRDPFLRPGTRTRSSSSGPAEPTPPPLTIQGIIMGTTPRAMINGRSVGVGDVIEGATVVSISSNSVEIEFNGRRHTIPYR